MVVKHNRNSKKEKRVCKPNNSYFRELFPLDTWDTKYRANYLAKLINIQQNKCNLCSEKIKNVDTSIVDHIVQKHYCKIYGKIHIDKIQNCQVLCPSCNHIKTYKVDTKINKMIKDNHSITQTYDGLRSYTINLLRKIYREKQEDLAKVKETTNQDINSSDSEDESDKKSIEKVFSKLQNISKSLENDFDKDLNKDNDVEYIDLDDLDDFDNQSNNKKRVNNSEDNESISKKKEIQRVTRSKTGSLPKKVEIQKQNVIITKSKESDSRNSVKRKIDYDSDDEIEVDELPQEEIMIQKKVKKNDKYISFVFKGCTFNNCTISL